MAAHYCGLQPTPGPNMADMYANKNKPSYGIGLSLNLVYKNHLVNSFFTKLVRKKNDFLFLDMAFSRCWYDHDADRHGETRS